MGRGGRRGFEKRVIVLLFRCICAIAVLPFCCSATVFFITGSAFPMFQVLLRLGLAVVSIVFSIEVIELRLSVSHVYGISFVLGSLFFLSLP